MEKEPDWPLLWRQLVGARARGMDDREDDSQVVVPAKACAFDEHAKKRWAQEDSSRRFLVELLGDHPGSTVLDIGAGTGSWACMLASHAAKVTALEPASTLIAALRKNVEASGATNVEILQGAWPEAHLEVHDFSLCSHAMYGCPDFPGFLRRMDEVSRKGCLLLLRAPQPDGLMAEISREIWGQPHDSPNFQIAYNILLQMGIFANVLMEDTGPWRPWTHGSLEEALADVKRRMGLTEEGRHDAYLERILRQRLTFSEGRYVWPSGVRSALVYWFK